MESHLMSSLDGGTGNVCCQRAAKEAWEYDNVCGCDGFGRELGEEEEEEENGPAESELIALRRFPPKLGSSRGGVFIGDLRQWLRGKTVSSSKTLEVAVREVVCLIAMGDAVVVLSAVA